MPELPEVETARRLIADEALHRRITDVDDSDTFVCRPHSPGELRAALTGRTLTAARRRGKSMWCETSEAGPTSAFTSAWAAGSWSPPRTAAWPKAGGRADATRRRWPGGIRSTGTGSPNWPHRGTARTYRTADRAGSRPVGGPLCS